MEGGDFAGRIVSGSGVEEVAHGGSGCASEDALGYVCAKLGLELCFWGDDCCVNEDTRFIGIDELSPRDTQSLCNDTTVYATQDVRYEE